MDSLPVQFSLYGGLSGSAIENLDDPSSDVNWVVLTIVKVSLRLWRFSWLGIFNNRHPPPFICLALKESPGRGREEDKEMEENR